MNIEIRDATIKDLDSLVAFNEQVQNIHVSLFLDVFRRTDASVLTDWFKLQMGDAAVSVVVACEAERVVAYLIMCMSTRDSNVFCHVRI